MKEAFGGILNFVLLTVFLLIVMGVLGLTVSYTKAFRMKNAVISRIEQYEGSGCFNANGRCFDQIVKDAQKLGYSPTVRLNCAKGESIENYFCMSESKGLSKSYSKVVYNGKDKVTQTVNTNVKYYDISTQVDINIPIINKILGLDFFQVSGSTRGIEF